MLLASAWLSRKQSLVFGIKVKNKMKNGGVPNAKCEMKHHSYLVEK